MSDTKHTPGPWEWERIEEEGCVPVSTLKGPDVLCRIWDSGVTGERDTHLIAAAPDMLAALQLISDNLFMNTENATLVEWEEAEQALLTAIAKATGAEQ